MDILLHINGCIITILNTKETFTYVKDHGDKDNDSEIDIKSSDEEYDGNDYISNGRYDLEYDVREKISYGISSAVHHTQNFTSLPSKMPPETQSVQVTEQFHLCSKK